MLNLGFARPNIEELAFDPRELGRLAEGGEADRFRGQITQRLFHDQVITLPEYRRFHFDVAQSNRQRQRQIEGGIIRGVQVQVYAELSLACDRPRWV